MSVTHFFIMNTPRFAQLSSINQRKDKSKKVTMRPGFYADMLKSTPEQLLTN